MKKMEPKQKKACEDLRREFGMSARYFNWRSQEDSNDQDWTPVNQANANITSATKGRPISSGRVNTSKQ